MAAKKKVTGIIQIYSKKARDQVFGIGLKFAKEAGIPEVTEDLFACVDELIKNAVKANYKFLLVVDKIAGQLLKKNPDKTPDQIKQNIFDILKDRQTYDRLASQIITNEYISEKVRHILSQEGKYLSIRNRVYAENRDYTEEEKKKISELKEFLDIRRQLKEQDIKHTI
jgi:uncharacterized secreted protein with C-terminal beta-propeller domain